MRGCPERLFRLACGKRRGVRLGASFCVLASLLLVASEGISVAGDAQAPGGNAGGGTVMQQPPENPASAPLPLFPTQPPATNATRGLLGDVGGWWDSARDKFENFKKQSDAVASGAQDIMKSATEATRDAANALGRLPNTRLFEVRERCQTAPNGAPDCETAATAVCRAKGFKFGQPMGVSSMEKCPTAVVLSGRTPAMGECPVETTVLIAACQ